MPLILAALLYPINDITTTPAAPPRLGWPYPEEKFAALQYRLYPSLVPWKSSLSPKDLFARAEELARAQAGWQVVEAEGLYLHAVVTTPLLRFKDDVAIDVRAESPAGSSLHMRSRSRLGRSDFGANYKRIRAFLNLV